MHSVNYTIESLILDKDFIKWAKNPSTEDGTKWLVWSSGSADNEYVLNEARELVTGLSTDNDAPEADELAALWNRIQATNREHDRTETQVKHSLFRIGRYRVAAAIGFFFLLSATLLYVANRPVKHETEYGARKIIRLPDSSIVILNAHSTVKYAANWGNDKPREIWLSGEGFFSVVHKNNAQKFIVHTHDLSVQVLGTKFNVNTLRERTRVILNSGKVKLYLANRAQKVVEMKPGELVDFSSTAGTLLKKTVKAQNYSAWVHKKLLFEDAPLREVAHVLEDNYGYKVVFRNPALADLDFTGTVDSGNEDLLLTILQKTFNLSITKQKGTITISEK